MSRNPLANRKLLLLIRIAPTSYTALPQLFNQHFVDTVLRSNQIKSKKTYAGATQASLLVLTRTNSVVNQSHRELWKSR